MSKIDFSTSAKRHFQDAKFVEDNNLLANAGQLYGFCAECGIKALLIALGYPTDAEGSPINQALAGNLNIRKHINQLVAIRIQIDSYASGRSGAKYLALIPNIDSFADWSVDHRYYDQHQIPPSITAWQQAATEMMRMMQEASSDGVLR